MQTLVEVKKATFIFIYTLVLSGSVLAQKAVLYEIPFKLPVEVNSEAEEAAVFVSPDGETLFFSRIMYDGNTGGVKGGQDIWSSSSDGKGGWYLAEHNLLTLNNKGNNAVIGISEDGSMVYLLNKYVGKRTSLGVSFATKEGDNWSEPKPLIVPGLIVNSSFYGFNMDPSGMFLILSLNSRETLGQEDLYVSKNEGGTWSAPIHLGNVINTEGFEITPFITADTKSLYFSTDAREGYGNADIYRSERLDDTWTNWSEPVNMGENINSAGFDAFFSITPENRIFFCSNRSGMLSDIFESKVVDHLVISEIEGSELGVIVGGEEEVTSPEVDVVEEAVAVIEESEPIVESVMEEPALEVPNLTVDSEEQPSENEAVVVEEEAEEPVVTEEVAEAVVEEVMVEENATPEELLAMIEEEEAEPVEATVVPEETAEADLPIEIETGGEEVVVEEAIVEEVAEEPVVSEEAVIEEVTEEPVVTEDPVVAEEAVIEEVVVEEIVTEVIEEEITETTSEVVENREREDPTITEEESPVMEVPALVAEPEPVIEETAEVIAVVEEEEVAEPVREVTPEPVVNDEPLVSEVSARREISGAGYVYFDHNSSYFNEEEAKKLKTIYDQLGSQPQLKLEVLGYSDNLGENFYNMWISERRANRVIQYLVEKGIDESRMSSKWFGEANQAASCGDCSDDQHQKNRRVELILQ